MFVGSCCVIRRPSCDVCAEAAYALGVLHAPVVVVADDAVVPCLFPSSDESTLFVSVAQSKSSLMGTQSIVARSVSAAKRCDSWCDVTVTLSFD